ELELTPFPLKEISGDVVKLFGFVPGSDGVKISFECAPSVPEWVKGDGNRYRQVLSNLVSNAVKFAGKGEVRVSLRMEDRPATGNRLYVMVRDTGPGIAPEVLPRLFQNFAQADASVARRFGGSGLGLAICKGLCEAMGGEISVHSELGKGSTFEFSIPVQAVAPPAHAEGPEFPLEEDPQGLLRVLVVDDNIVNLRLANAFLTKYGCLVETAEDGAAGLAKAVAGEHDLVLMDCQMPGMDGYESASLIVKELGPKRPRIYALTGNTDPADVAACLKVGMDGVLSKPLAIKEIQSLLQSVRLERQGRGRSLWSK
ncbi:MAG: response regulator, partial [Proteobacteria bacterium]